MRFLSVVVIEMLSVLPSTFLKCGWTMHNVGVRHSHDEYIINPYTALWFSLLQTVCMKVR